MQYIWDISEDQRFPQTFDKRVISGMIMTSKRCISRQVNCILAYKVTPSRKGALCKSWIPGGFSKFISSVIPPSFWGLKERKEQIALFRKNWLFLLFQPVYHHSLSEIHHRPYLLVYCGRISIIDKIGSNLIIENSSVM